MPVAGLCQFQPTIESPSGIERWLTVVENYGISIKSHGWSAYNVYTAGRPGHLDIVGTPPLAYPDAMMAGGGWMDGKATTTDGSSTSQCIYPI